MIIMGVDPGTVISGYGIVRWERSSKGNRKLQHVHSGIVKNTPNTPMPQRLNSIYLHLCEIIKKYNPSDLAIESSFYGKNVQSAMKIGYARGVSLLAAVQHGLDASEYSPREVKRAISGNGAASKEQVLFMVCKLLNLDKESILHDASDALAVAICHIHRIAIK